MQLYEEQANWLSPIEKVTKKKYLKTAPYCCPTCRKAWQPYGYESCDPQKSSEFLKDFPTIGCYKLKCSRCK